MNFAISVDVNLLAPGVHQEAKKKIKQKHAPKNCMSA